MRKTILAILLAFCYSLAKAGVWTGTGNYSLSWYTGSSSSQVFTISSEQEMAGLAYLVNNGYADFSGKIVELAKDLNLCAHTWIGIGAGGYSFKGLFLGQGHKIEGIRLVAESGKYPDYGFWINLYGADIRDLTLAGTASLNFSDAAYPNTVFGTFAANASSCRFENCISAFDISYSRSSTNKFTYKVNIGGMVGKLANSSMTRCLNKGSINVDFGRSGRNSEYYDSSSSITVGGLVAEADASVFMYCGNSSGSIRLNAAGSKNANTLPLCLGGIVGLASSSTEMTCCFNNSRQFESIFRGDGSASMKLGGIAASAVFYTNSKGGLYNCYSSTNKFDVTVQNYASNVYCGGVVAYYNSSASDKYKASFGPSDLTVTSLINFNLIEGYSGSDAYSESQMKTAEFLSELNLYSIMNGWEGVWTSNGGYPYIGDDEATSIGSPATVNEESEVVVVDGCLEFGKSTNVQVYSMDGRLEFFGNVQRTRPLPRGCHVLKVGSGSRVVMIR